MTRGGVLRATSLAGPAVTPVHEPVRTGAVEMSSLREALASAPMYPGTIAASTPDHPAYVMASTGRRVTYRELDDRSNQLAQLLHQRGLRRGDGFALCMENNDTFFPVVWAGARSGLYYTAVSTRLTPGEIEYIV